MEWELLCWSGESGQWCAQERRKQCARRKVGSVLQRQQCDAVWWGPWQCSVWWGPWQCAVVVLCGGALAVCCAELCGRAPGSMLLWCCVVGALAVFCMVLCGSVWCWVVLGGGALGSVLCGNVWWGSCQCAVWCCVVVALDSLLSGAGWWGPWQYLCLH